MDQAIPTGGAGIPPIIADLYFRPFRFNNTLGIGGQCLDLIDVAVFFTQPGELLFISPPSPTIKKEDQKYANKQCQHASHHCRSLTVFPTNHLKHGSSKSNYEYDGQQLNERISPTAFAVGNRHKLFLVELGLPLIQERDDFVKFGRLTEKHLLHLSVVLSQRFQSVLWRHDSQCSFGRFAILRP